MPTEGTVPGSKLLRQLAASQLAFSQQPNPNSPGSFPPLPAEHNPGAPEGTGGRRGAGAAPAAGAARAQPAAGSAGTAAPGRGHAPLTSHTHPTDITHRHGTPPHASHRLRFAPQGISKGEEGTASLRFAGRRMEKINKSQHNIKRWI